MPSGVKSLLSIPTGKSAIGCLSAAPQSCSTYRRYPHSPLPIAAAAVHPWPWRSMSTDSTPSLKQGVKLSSCPIASHFGQPAKQAETESLWHAVDLQEDSSSYVPSAVESTEAAADAFKVKSAEQLQDVFNCLVLAETVYKVQDGNHAEVAATVAALRQDFPAAMVTLQRLQWSLPHVPHRYLLAESKDALYVAFIGTKQRRDIITNANIMQQPMWPDSPHAMPSAHPQGVPAAHTGFLSRARGVPIHALYQQATRRNQRLVFTGHSLGGAVALLCTLDLLHGLGTGASPKLACVGFATPAVGNAALADCAKAKGWDNFITNYLVPEDVIARLIPPQLAASVQSAEQVADQASGPAHPALWAPLAHQPPSCLALTSTPSTLSLPSDEGRSVQEPATLVCTSNLGDWGKVQGATPFQRPSLRPSLRTANRSWQVNRHKSTAAVSHHLAQRSTQSAAAHAQLPVTLPVVGSNAQSIPMMHSNIVPLQSHAHRGRGSKRMYNSLFDRSSRQTAPLQQLDSRQAGSTVCNSRVQVKSESSTSSSTVDVDSDVKQQQNSPSAMTGAGLWTRTTQLARLVSFPVRVTRAYYSYVPLGQQLYLNPQSVSTSMQTPQPQTGPQVGPGERTSAASAIISQQAAAVPTVAPATLNLASRPIQQQAAAASVSDALSDVVDSVVMQRKNQLGRLWMHRMPTYRARFQQIFFSALGQPLPLLPPVSGQPGSAIHVQGKPIAPEIHVRRAEACAGSLMASHHLQDMLKGSVTAVAEQGSFRWFWIWSGVWPAIRSRLRQNQQDITFQISVCGHGIQHVNSTQAYFENELLTARIVKHMGHEHSFPAQDEGVNLLQAALALLLSSGTGREMVLEVVVPARLAQKAQGQLASSGSLKLDITVQSDFCASSAPVTFRNDTKALQDSLVGMTALYKVVNSMLLQKSKSCTQVASL